MRNEYDLVERKLKQNIGIIEGNKKGFAFFIPDDSEEEHVFIGQDDLNGALHGDRVQIKIFEEADKDGRKAEGRVLKIIERNIHNIVGRYQSVCEYGFVIPDIKNYFKDIYIPKGMSMSASENDKVLVKIDKFPEESESPEGHVITVIGPQGGKGVDISSVALSFDLPYKFCKESLEEVKSLPLSPSEDEFIGREDFRDLYTVTIDGADAKDFDDAISIDKKDGDFYLYVHIADVSHYVKEGSNLDKEAYIRGNSIYLLDRVIPMLPEELSNGLCSLKPGEDRLSMTTSIHLTSEGEVVDYSFYPSVIRSDHRLVYDDVSDYLEFGKVFSADELLLDKLDLMKELFTILADKREARGSMDFDMPETNILLDENGKAIQVEREERRTANRIIEEFMILNNEIVGQHFFNLHIPYIYRVHGKPDIESVERLNEILLILNYPQLPKRVEPRDIKELLEISEGSPEEGVLNMMALRSMQKAIYSSNPDMHFGLASDHYSHFTAPIRRYSDIIAHRLMKFWLNGNAQEGDGIKNRLFDQCRHISECEEKAEEAERDVIDMKCAEYMQEYIGHEFDGIVSSLTNFGIFIMLENTVEGLSHFRDMQDDYYTFDEKSLCVKGERSGREYRYGDRVRVLVTSSNPENREIDFKIITDGEGKHIKKKKFKRLKDRKKRKKGKDKNININRTYGYKHNKNNKKKSKKGKKKHKPLKNSRRKHHR